MSFRFTLFNNCTLFVMALTIVVLVRRLKVLAGGVWPLVYYGVLFGYTFGFPYSLNRWWVLGGLATALGQRIGKLAWLRWAEVAVLGYVCWRCLELLLGW